MHKIDLLLMMIKFIKIPVLLIKEKLLKIKNLLVRLIKVFKKSKEIIINNKIQQVPEMHSITGENTLQIPI